MATLSKCLFLVFAVTLLAGCSGGGADRMDTVPVSGKVTYNGEPLAGAQIRFFGDGSPAANAVTDAQGVYKLTTYESGDGAVPGKKTVTVSKTTGGTDAPPSGEGDEDATALADPAMMNVDPDDPEAGLEKSVIPDKYAVPMTSGLTADITDAKTDLNFDLTD